MKQTPFYFHVIFYCVITKVKDLEHMDKKNFKKNYIFVKKENK